MFSFAKIEIAGVVPPEEFLLIRAGFIAEHLRARQLILHHVSIWLNTAQLITLNLPHHTLSTPFFATLFVVNT